MNFPENLKYSNDHEWVLVNGNQAVVGISEYAQSELGEIVFVEVPGEGDQFSMGDIFGSIEAVKTVSDLMLPFSGKIIAVNERLEDNPELVNQDPYGEGWIVKVEIADLSELDGLLSAEAYSKLIGK